MTTATKQSRQTSNGKQPEAFDLDALEREANHVPFRFTLGGEDFTMASPEDADWRVQMDVRTDDAESLRTFIADLLGGPQEYERFAAHRLAGWKLDKLLDAVVRHYGVSVPELRASPGSSTPTGTR